MCDPTIRADTTCRRRRRRKRIQASRTNQPNTHRTIHRPDQTHTSQAAINQSSNSYSARSEFNPPSDHRHSTHRQRRNRPSQLPTPTNSSMPPMRSHADRRMRKKKSPSNLVSTHQSSRCYWANWRLMLHGAYVSRRACLTGRTPPSPSPPAAARWLHPHPRRVSVGSASVSACRLLMCVACLLCRIA